MDGVGAVSARSDMLLHGFAGAAVALALVGAVQWATMDEEGWVCGNAETGQVVDVTRNGRTFSWTDQWGVQHSIGPREQSEWLCAKVNKDAHQMTAPLGEFDL